MRLAFFVSLLVCLVGRAQGQVNWSLAVAPTAAAFTDSHIVANATDASGNVFVAGNFTGTITFGSVTLTSVGSQDMFVAKWSPTAAGFVWAQRAGGPQNDVAAGLAVAGSTVYLTGNFSGAATFGAVTLASAGGQDIFVAKLTDAGASGSFTWAQRAGGIGSESVNTVAVSGSSVYLAGQIGDYAATFGPISVISAGLADMFVAKLTDTGSTSSFAWVQRVGGPYNEGASALAVSGSNVYVAGGFNLGASAGGSVLFGSIPLTSLTPYGASFVAKLADAGTSSSFVWAQKAAGLETFSAGVAVSGSSVYFTGTFNSTVQLGSLSLASTGDYDTFVAKLTDAGTSSSYIWAQRAGGTYTTQPGSIAAVGTNVYLVGSFSGTATFGSTLLANVNTTQPGTYPRYADMYAAKLIDAGASGTFAWAKAAGGQLNDGAMAVAVGGPNVYVSGFVTPSASFGARTIASPAGYAVAFLAAIFDALPPTLTSFTPSSGPTNTTSVTLTGTNLTGAAYVTFNGTPAAGYFTNPAGTQLTVTVPDGATTGLIAVTTPAGTATSATPFTVTGQGPLITGFSLPFAKTGQSIVISGANLAGAIAVTFSGVSQPVFTVNAAGSQLTAQVPYNTSQTFPTLPTGPVRVTTNIGTATSPSSLRLLALTGAATAGYPGGLMASTATLTGSGFTGGSVQFVLNYPNPVSYPAMATVQNDSLLTVIVPDVSGTTAMAPNGSWVVSNTPGTVDANYELLSPVVSSIAPANAPAGSTVTVTGFNFQRADPRPPYNGQVTAITGFLFTTGTSSVNGSGFQLLGSTGSFAQQRALVTVPPGLSGPAYVQATGGTLMGGGVIQGLPFSIGLASATSNGSGTSSFLGMYPNPASTWVTVRTEAAPASQKVRVLDRLGRCVREQVLPAYSTELELSLAQLTAGVYAVHCGNRAVRLVVQ